MPVSMPLSRSRVRFGFVAILLVLVPTLPLHAQFERIYDSWRWVHFDQESGLPSDRVLNIVETDDGQVWAHTSRGVAWFDGFRWNPVHLPSVPSAAMETGLLAAAPHGVIFWTYADVFVLHPTATRAVPRPSADMQFGPTYSIGSDTLLTQLGLSLYIIVGDSVRIVDSPLERVSRTARESRPVEFRLLEGDTPWLLAGSALFRWTPAGWTKMIEPASGFIKVEKIAEDRAGNGIATVEDEPGVVRVYEWAGDARPRRHPTEQGDLATSVAFTPKGEPVILTATGKFRIRRGGQWSTLPELPPPIIRPLRIRFRANGDLWTATDDGLYLCRISSETWTTWRFPGHARENVITEIFRSRDSTWWIGTRNGVVRRWPDGTLRSYKQIGGQSLGRVTGINEDDDGNIWISSGSSFSGAYRLRKNEWKHFDSTVGLRAPRVHKIARDRQGRLWFLGMEAGSPPVDGLSDPGAFVFENGTFTKWGPQQGLPDGRVYCFGQDTEGTLWFGTRTGLSRWRNGTWTIWRKKDGLRVNRVFTLTVDHNNRVWFGHNWEGVGTIDPTDSVRYITSVDGLPSNKVWGLATDEANRVWATTENGLACISYGGVASFETHSGLPNPMLWPVVPYKGKVYVGTMGDGVVVLSNPFPETPHPRVTVEPPSIVGQTAAFRWYADAFWGGMNARQIPTRYRMDDGPWSTWSPERRFRAENLSYGDHVISIQSRKTFGGGESLVVSERFELAPPFYLRPSFYGPLGGLIALLMWISSVSRSRKKAMDRIIRENEQRFRSQYRGAPIPTLTVRNREGTLVLMDSNDAAIELSGGRITQSVGGPLRQVFTHVPAFLEMIDRCYADRSTVRAEVRYPLFAPEESIDVDLTCRFVFPDMVLVHIRDIRPEKAAQEEIRQSREQLRALGGRLESIREEERRRLSREIHDELGQAITGLKMDVSWIRKKVTGQAGPATSGIIERLSLMTKLLDETIHSVRRMASDLRPVVLDDLGLLAAVEWQAREFRERTGITCTLDLPPDLPPLRRDTSTEIFRIFQEILTNVARHARARTVSIHLQFKVNRLQLRCHDDGIGMQFETLEKRGTLGILGMEERARRIGGTLLIESRSGQGTTVSVDLPLTEEHSL